MTEFRFVGLLIVLSFWLLLALFVFAQPRVREAIGSVLEGRRARKRGDWCPPLRCRVLGCHIFPTGEHFNQQMGPLMFMCPLEVCSFCGLGVLMTPNGPRQLDPKKLELLRATKEGVAEGKVVPIKKPQ